MEELKPCGCGGEAKVIKHEYFECSPTYGVTCYKCGTATYHGFDTETEAIQAWNTAMNGSAEEKLKAFWDGMSAEMKEERTAKVEYIAEVYRGEIVDHYLSGMCGICGEYAYDHAKYCSDCGAKLDWSGNE